MRILVTGGAGFVGSNLVHRLVWEGNHVTCLDDLSTGRIDNIEDLRPNPRFEFIQHDVRTPYTIAADQIYNLACPASPPHYQSDPIKTTMTCVLGMNNALELARRTGATVLQASTSEVYGDPLVHPQVESYRGHVNPIGPRSCYDEGKRVAESLCFDFKRMYGTKVKIARIFNTYGPGMRPDDGRIISNFILSALHKQSLTVYGNGTQTRSFCYVDDLVDGLIRVMNDSFTAGPYNVGNPSEQTVLQVADTVRRHVNPGSSIEYRALPADDPKQRCPDITTISTETGWRPRVDFETGIMTTIDYFKRGIPTK